jgi:hypothetical protein
MTIPACHQDWLDHGANLDDAWSRGPIYYSVAVNFYYNTVFLKYYVNTVEQKMRQDFYWIWTPHQAAKMVARLLHARAPRATYTALFF